VHLEAAVGDQPGQGRLGGQAGDRRRQTGGRGGDQQDSVGGGGLDLGGWVGEHAALDQLGHGGSAES
jgi:hypothetical protein